MQNTVKFNKKQHESESVKVDGFDGLHSVDVAGEGEYPKGHAEAGKPYTYGVDEKTGERNGKCQIVLVSTAKTKTELAKRITNLVNYSVASGNSEKDAINEVVNNLNHSRNINQRQPFRPSVSNSNGVREFAKKFKAAKASGVTQEEIDATLAKLIERANNASMTK